MATHYLHHGGAGVRNREYALYPSAKPTPVDRLAPAAHKEPIAFGITRLLDFSELDGRRQAGLQQYLEQAAGDGTPLQQGDICTLSAIPSRSLLLGFAWEVEVPEAGVTFDIKTLYGALTLETGVNAGAPGSSGALLDKPLWIADGDYLTVEFTTFPAKGASTLRFSVTPIVLTPKLGN